MKKKKKKYQHSSKHTPSRSLSKAKSKAQDDKKEKVKTQVVVESNAQLVSSKYEDDSEDSDIRKIKKKKHKHKSSSEVKSEKKRKSKRKHKDRQSDGEDVAPKASKHKHSRQSDDEDRRKHKHKDGSDDEDQDTDRQSDIEARDRKLSKHKHKSRHSDEEDRDGENSKRREEPEFCKGKYRQQEQELGEDSANEANRIAHRERSNRTNGKEQNSVTHKRRHTDKEAREVYDQQQNKIKHIEEKQQELEIKRKSNPTELDQHDHARDKHSGKRHAMDIDSDKGHVLVTCTADINSEHRASNEPQETKRRHKHMDEPKTRKEHKHKKRKHKHYGRSKSKSRSRSRSQSRTSSSATQNMISADSKSSASSSTLASTQSSIISSFFDPFADSGSLDSSSSPPPPPPSSSSTPPPPSSPPPSMSFEPSTSANIYSSPLGPTFPKQRESSPKAYSDNGLVATYNRDPQREGIDVSNSIEKKLRQNVSHELPSTVPNIPPSASDSASPTPLSSSVFPSTTPPDHSLIPTRTGPSVPPSDSISLSPSTSSFLDLAQSLPSEGTSASESLKETPLMKSGSATPECGVIEPSKDELQLTPSLSKENIPIPNSSPISSPLLNTRNHLSDIELGANLEKDSSSSLEIFLPKPASLVSLETSSLLSTSSSDVSLKINSDSLLSTSLAVSNVSEQKAIVGSSFEALVQPGIVAVEKLSSTSPLPVVSQSEAHSMGDSELRKSQASQDSAGKHMATPSRSPEQRRTSGDSAGSIHRSEDQRSRESDGIVLRSSRTARSSTTTDSNDLPQRRYQDQPGRQSRQSSTSSSNIEDLSPEEQLRRLRSTHRQSAENQMQPPAESMSQLRQPSTQQLLAAYVQMQPQAYEGSDELNQYQQKQYLLALQQYQLQQLQLQQQQLQQQQLQQQLLQQKQLQRGTEQTYRSSESNLEPPALPAPSPSIHSSSDGPSSPFMRQPIAALLAPSVSISNLFGASGRTPGPSAAVSMRPSSTPVFTPSAQTDSFVLGHSGSLTRDTLAPSRSNVESRSLPPSSSLPIRVPPSPTVIVPPPNLSRPKVSSPPPPPPKQTSAKPPPAVLRKPPASIPPIASPSIPTPSAFKPEVKASPPVPLTVPRTDRDDVHQVLKSILTSRPASSATTSSTTFASILKTPVIHTATTPAATIPKKKEPPKKDLKQQLVSLATAKPTERPKLKKSDAHEVLKKDLTPLSQNEKEAAKKLVDTDAIFKAIGVFGKVALKKFDGKQKCSMADYKKIYKETCHQLVLDFKALYHQDPRQVKTIELFLTPSKKSSVLATVEKKILKLQNNT